MPDKQEPEKLISLAIFMDHQAKTRLLVVRIIRYWKKIYYIIIINIRMFGNITFRWLYQVSKHPSILENGS